MTDEPLVPWKRIAAFIRQHTHDVRNELNCLDLECAQMQEIVPEGEARTGLDRIKRVSRSIAQQMRELSARCQDGRPISGPVPARALLTIWREKHAALPDAPAAEWTDGSSEADISVDVEMMAAVFRELLVNAASFAPQPPISISSRCEGAWVILELRERKAVPVDTREWTEPFFSTRRGRHGLGLWMVKRYVEAHGGSFEQRYESANGTLISSIRLSRAN